MPRDKLCAMTRSELITRLAERFPQLVRVDIELAVKKILDALSDTLAAGDRAEIRGFGSFGINSRPPRLARNPKTGERVPVPEKRVPHFKPGFELRQRVNGEPPSVENPLEELPNRSGGRPATNGVKPGWELMRSTIAIEAFTSARRAGEKYEFALEAASDAVRKHFPGMKISPSMVKKILKDLMPEDAEEVIRVTKEIAPDDTDSAKMKVTYGVGFSPRQSYPHPSRQKK